MATRIYKTPFAATGDKEPLATTDQPDGKVSLQAGWTPDYELPNDNANYRPVGRGEMNGVLNELTAALGEIQLNGYAKWQSIEGGWPLGSYVLHNAVVYRSMTDNNTSDPEAELGDWLEQPSGIATQTETDAGINGVKAITPQTLKSLASLLTTANGFLRLPSWLGGLTLQWGFSNSIPSGSSVTVTYPTQFQNQTLIAIAGLDANAPAVQNYTVACGNGTKTTLVIYNYSTLSASTRWIAIGF